MSSYKVFPSKSMDPVIDLDLPAILKIAKKEAKLYANRSPYPHAVFDGFFDDKLLSHINSEVDNTPKDIEKMFYGAVGKFAEPKRKVWGGATRSLIAELNSAEFLQFLEALTGIEGLISDPYYEGGGIHEIRRGGFLKIHTDFNYHKKLKLDRRINVLLYLNDDWDESYGGELELWNQDMSTCIRKIQPIINRLVVFSTTDTSFHGHPVPLTCPEDRSRRSLALYYYTNGRPESEVEFKHSVSTNYQQRPGEVFDKSIKAPKLVRIVKKVRKLVK